MENNNRQGCRWTKIYEKGMPKEIGKVHWRATNLQGEHEPISAGVAYSTIRKGGAVDFIEYLDESIEPCATSSENYWKQRCEAAEALIWIDMTSPNWDKRHKNWQQLKSQTPSPTGDRDCEELKKEVERLKVVIRNQWMAANRFGERLGEQAVEIEKRYCKFKTENNL